MMKRFINENKGFTGLEAAIVLTAFVVVAAVFSYVVLGAGFFTTDTAKQVVHTGVEQATSSVAIVGDVMAAGTGTNVTNITITLQLTAGNNPVDMTQNMDQIVKAARTTIQRKTSMIQLRLEPPELGLLRIEIKQGATGLNLQLQATSHRAHQLLQQHSSELRTALEPQALQANQIDVQLRLDLRNDSSPSQNQPQEHTDGQNDPSYQDQFQQSAGNFSQPLQFRVDLARAG